MIESIKYELCRQCGNCRWVCPKDVVGWNEQKNRPHITYGDECQTCFQCTIVCESKAIKINAKRTKGVTKNGRV